MEWQIAAEERLKQGRQGAVQEQHSVSVVEFQQPLEAPNPVHQGSRHQVEAPKLAQEPLQEPPALR